MPEEPGLVQNRVRQIQYTGFHNTASSPALEPDDPRFCIALARRGGQGSARAGFLECPKEEGVIGMACTIDCDVARVVARQRSGDIWKLVRDLKVWWRGQREMNANHGIWASHFCHWGL